MKVKHLIQRAREMSPNLMRSRMYLKMLIFRPFDGGIFRQLSDHLPKREELAGYYTRTPEFFGMIQIKYLLQDCFSKVLMGDSGLLLWH